MTKHYRVTVIEWLTHRGTVEAATPEQAECLAHHLWATNTEHETFSFEDSGVDGIAVEEVQP